MQKQNFSQGGFMPQNRQYYRKVKYPDKVAKLKSLVFVRIFLFCSVGIKIQYFPTAPFLTLDTVTKQPFYKKFLNENKYYKCRNHGDDTCSHLSFPGCLIK